MCNSTWPEELNHLDPALRGQIAGRLAEAGLRLTTQREAVCEAVFGCPGHICVEHILQVVTQRHSQLKMNKTTVYRALEMLMDLGLVTEHKCGDGRAQYEPASRGRHSHMICRGCGELLDLDDDTASRFSEALRSRHGFQADLESYPVFGLCSACRG